MGNNHTTNTKPDLAQTKPLPKLTLHPNTARVSACTICGEPGDPPAPRCLKCVVRLWMKAAGAQNQPLNLIDAERACRIRLYFLAAGVALAYRCSSGAIAQAFAEDHQGDGVIDRILIDHIVTSDLAEFPFEHQYQQRCSMKTLSKGRHRSTTHHPDSASAAVPRHHGDTETVQKHQQPLAPALQIERRSRMILQKNTTDTDLHHIQERYRTSFGLPVREENGKLVMRAGSEVGAVLMPAELGACVLASMGTVPVIAHRRVTWFFLTQSCGEGLELPVRVRTSLFTERVTRLQAGSLITLPDKTMLDGLLLREWVAEPICRDRPDIAEVLEITARSLSYAGKLHAAAAWSCAA